MPTRSRLMEALYNSLPASSGKVLAQHLTEQLGRTITEPRAHSLNSYARRHRNRLGWTVPHVSHGLRKRFVRVPVQHEEGYELTPQVRRYVEDGALANVVHVAQRYGNAAGALLGTAAQMPPSAQRTKLEGLADDTQYLQRRTLRVAADIREANGE